MQCPAVKVNLPNGIRRHFKTEICRLGFVKWSSLWNTTFLFLWFILFLLNFSKTCVVFEWYKHWGTSTLACWDVRGELRCIVGFSSSSFCSKVMICPLLLPVWILWLCKWECVSCNSYMQGWCKFKSIYKPLKRSKYVWCMLAPVKKFADLINFRTLSSMIFNH